MCIHYGSDVLSSWQGCCSPTPPEVHSHNRWLTTNSRCSIHRFLFCCHHEQRWRRYHWQWNLFWLSLMWNFSWSSFMWAPAFSATNPKPTSVPPQPQQDDIWTTYHPRSKQPTVVKSFGNYGHSKWAAPPTPPIIPWLPFNLETEFLFAEIVLESAMSNKQVDALIKVVHKLLEHNEEFRVWNHEELEKLWVGAFDELAPVCWIWLLQNVFWSPL